MQCLMNDVKMLTTERNQAWEVADLLRMEKNEAEKSVLDLTEQNKRLKVDLEA